MKKVILTLLAVMTMSFAMAQSTDNANRQAPKHMTSEQKLEQMKTTLSLSDEQVAKIKVLNAKYADVFKGPGANGGQPPKRDNNSASSSEDNNKRPEMNAEMKAQMEKMMMQRKAYETELKGILSDSQYAAYQKMQPQRGQRPQKRQSEDE